MNCLISLTSFGILTVEFIRDRVVGIVVKSRLIIQDFVSVWAAKPHGASAVQVWRRGGSFETVTMTDFDME
jgi:hypothetical protein